MMKIDADRIRNRLFSEQPRALSVKTPPQNRARQQADSGVLLSTARQQVHHRRVILDGAGVKGAVTVRERTQ